MLIKQDTIKTMLFDNAKERDEYIDTYMKLGYTLIEFGSGESGYWFRAKLEQ